MIKNCFKQRNAVLVINHLFCFYQFYFIFEVLVHDNYSHNFNARCGIAFQFISFCFCDEYKLRFESNQTIGYIRLSGTLLCNLTS